MRRNRSASSCRTAAELSDILKQHPFRKDEPNLTYVIFLDGKPPRDALDKATGQTDEKMQLGKREIFVSYPNGMGRSKLKIPAAKAGTARNLNTVAALAAMAAKRELGGVGHSTPSSSAQADIQYMAPQSQ